MEETEESFEELEEIEGNFILQCKNLIKKQQEKEGNEQIEKKEKRKISEKWTEFESFTEIYKKLKF
jgi:hypothetical protein